MAWTPVRLKWFIANAYLDDWEQHSFIIMSTINCVMTGCGHICAPRRYWLMTNRWSVYTNWDNRGWTLCAVCTWPNLLMVTFVSWVNWPRDARQTAWLVSVMLATWRDSLPATRLLINMVWWVVCRSVYGENMMSRWAMCAMWGMCWTWC